MVDTGSARQVWQISGGPPGRDHVRFLLQHGLALLGPGDQGPWRKEEEDTAYGGPCVRRFATELRLGDSMLLRTGVAHICAVGLVAGEYLYLASCDDVQGADLQHARRVRWCPLPEPYEFHTSVFGSSPPALSLVNQSEVREYVERFLASPPLHWQTAPLPSLPGEEPPLVSYPVEISALVAQAQDLVPLYGDLTRFGDPPAEEELVAHYIVPLLRALGWPVECIGLQWNRVDVAVFDSLPRSPATCPFIVEAKRLGQGSEGALAQACGYLQALGVERDVVVSDGIRYRMYGAQERYAPVAYANLSRLKQSATLLFDRMRRHPRS